MAHYDEEKGLEKIARAILVLAKSVDRLASAGIDQKKVADFTDRISKTSENLEDVSNQVDPDKQNKEEKV